MLFWDAWHIGLYVNEGGVLIYAPSGISQCRARMTLRLEMLMATEISIWPAEYAMGKQQRVP